MARSNREIYTLIDYMWRWIVTTTFLLTFILGTSVITIPFAVSLAGFWPSLIAILLSWGYLLFTGFYYVETVFANPPGANVFSMALRYTGIGGAWFSSTIFALVHYGYFIFFFYLVSPILSELFFRMGFYIPNELSLLFLVIILGGSVAIGLRFTLIFNFILTPVALGLLYICFAAGLKPAMETKITEFKWGYLFIVFPSLVNSLYYNTIVPTLAPIFKYNRKQLVACIVTALTLSALIFAIWLWLAIASGGTSLASLSKLNPEFISFSSLYRVPIFGKWLPLILSLAVAQTGLGVGTVLVDFFADFLNIPLEKRRGWRRVALSALAFIPPLLLNLSPSQFLYTAALYVTDIGPLYLTGLLPVMWVWSSRYFYKENVPPLVPGGKAMILFLAIIACFIFYLVGLEIFYQSTFTT